MKRPIALLFCLLMITMPMAGCLGGDDSSDAPDEELADWNVHFAATAADLPTCDEDTNGRLYYVEADGQFQVCKTSGWEIIAIKGEDGTDGEHGAAGANGQDGVNGNDGLDGNQGDDGFSTLIEITEESSGLNCVNGGVRVEAGLDSNRDNLLDSDEIDNIEYICDGISTDSTMLTSVSPEPSWKCTGGGRVISNGFDNGEGNGIAANGQLETDEVDFSTSFCTTRGTTEMGWYSYYHGEVAIYDDELYFLDYLSQTSSRLWKTNGTESSRVYVAITGYSNGDLITYADKLIFSAYDENNGTELWSYDTVNGASMLADINPAGSSNPENFTIYANNLYFVADDGVHGKELWKYDGSNALNAISMVLDINPGSDSSNPQYLTPFYNNMVFSADDGTHGYELWATENNGNTFLFADLRSGSTSSYPQELTSNYQDLYFSAIGNHGVYGRELYVCEDSASVVLCDLHEDINQGGNSGTPTNMIVIWGNLYFFAWDGEQRELRVCNQNCRSGTESSQMIDINQFGSSNYQPSNAAMIKYNDILYFSAYPSIDSSSKELLSFDGSTITIVDTTRGAVSPIVYEGELYYYGDYGGANYMKFMVTGGNLLDYTEVTYS